MLLTKEQLILDSRQIRDILSQQINFEGTVYRTMSFTRKQNYEAGQQLRIGSCWSTTGEYVPDPGWGRYVYCFVCENARGHKIDYDKMSEEELEAIGSSKDCEHEQEVLIHSEQLFESVSVDSTYEDFEEMGFYEVLVRML